MKKFMALLIALAIPGHAFCDIRYCYHPAGCQDRKALQKCILYQIATKDYYSSLPSMDEQLREPIKAACRIEYDHYLWSCKIDMARIGGPKEVDEKACDMGFEALISSAMAMINNSRDY